MDTNFIAGTVVQPEWLNDVNYLTYKWMRTPEHFGAVGDGVTDDHAALQEAADTGTFILFGDKTYATSQEIVFTNGTKFIGYGNWSAVTSNQINTATTQILYIGAGGTNSCVIRMSWAAVGTSTPTYIQNLALENIVINGNALAEFGVYMVRAWSNSRLNYITVTNTLKHGFWAAMCWNGSPTNWMAFKNLGCGISLGINTFGWANATVDESTMTSFFAYFNGYDFATVKQNQFNETTNPYAEAGISIGGGRGLVFINCQAAVNGGAGIQCRTEFSPVTFIGGYCEGNGTSTGSTRAWDIWVDGATSAGSWNITFDGMHLGLTPAIRLTGTMPSRVEHGVIFRRMGALGTIVADWGNYRLEDCDRNVTYVGTSPKWFAGQLNGARNMGVSGLVLFTGSTGSVVINKQEGVISGVTRVSAGVFDVGISETYSGADYVIQVTGADNYTVGTGSVTSSGFRLTNRNATTNAVEDANSRINVVVYGDY